MSAAKKLKALLFDPSLPRFLLVGVANTAVGMVLMFGSYNLLGIGYWPSVAIAYVLGMVLSFTLNKIWTFRSQNNMAKAALLFILLNIFAAIVSYGIAERLISVVLNGWEQKIRDHIAMLAGMILFTAINYFGQRFMVFRKESIHVQSSLTD